jgi:hypothetical protein
MSIVRSRQCVCLCGSRVACPAQARRRDALGCVAATPTHVPSNTTTPTFSPTAPPITPTPTLRPSGALGPCTLLRTRSSTHPTAIATTQTHTRTERHSHSHSHNRTHMQPPSPLPPSLDPPPLYPSPSPPSLGAPDTCGSILRVWDFVVGDLCGIGQRRRRALRSRLRRRARSLTWTPAARTPRARHKSPPLPNAFVLIERLECRPLSRLPPAL